ncbi:hypothetical protein FA15DRAFT_673031 [Coprinopsis marcescibilis]|uniref:Uncharacterized protein n=1 Tax=Coprinopsis marcescibilis TaxID=230819 RepID=A0A5C3KL93_COPMA|nr:hypothetical protein FA15DRAFT_673031 [Coprinopsis marcescibilis]
MSFPSPVGGVPLQSDLAPSILFAVLYGLLAPLVFYRLYDRRSRTLLLLGTMIFAIERIVIFSLRAVQSRDVERRLNGGLAIYMQVSFNTGFIGIASDLVNIIRCLLVNPTYGLERFPESPAASTKECYLAPPEEGEEDHARERFWARRFAEFTGLAFLSAVVPGIVANSSYDKTFNDPSRAQRTYTLRYASSGVALFLTIVLVLAAAWSKCMQKRAGKRGFVVISLLSFLVGIIACYRLSVMHNTTTALDSTAPGSLNTPGAKAAFYVLHVLPEWLVSAILLGCNVRKTFGTGMFGDWRGHDETPKEKASREKSEARRAERKQRKLQLEGREKGPV